MLRPPLRGYDRTFGEPHTTTYCRSKVEKCQRAIDWASFEEWNRANSIYQAVSHWQIKITLLQRQSKMENRVNKSVSQWHPIPYVVPMCEPIGLWSKAVHFIGNRAPFGKHIHSNLIEFKVICSFRRIVWQSSKEWTVCVPNGSLFPIDCTTFDLGP